jgi:hypothetical protein
MIVEADVESTSGDGAIVRTTSIPDEGRRRFFVDIDKGVNVKPGDRVSLDVDLNAVTARIVRVMGIVSAATKGESHV